MTDRAHWNRVYADKADDSLSWFEAAPGLSAALIEDHVRACAAVDVRAGASRLVDHLLDKGFAPVTAVDSSAEGLAVTRARLGPRAAAVDWVVGDVTAWTPPRRSRLWHDRAVLRFLTDPGARAAYARGRDAATAPGAVAIIATFAEDGPETCSGLPVRRYAPAELAAEIEAHLPGVCTPVESRRHLHVTPAGSAQRFQFPVLRKVG
ncbi:MAG TPA: SAM-dependent methyltransferase [Rhodobacteraceae bacterium]|nr:SAM-dependent methyltransferase [Paracoccaceae bacterium]